MDHGGLAEASYLGPTAYYYVLQNSVRDRKFVL